MAATPEERQRFGARLRELRGERAQQDIVFDLARRHGVKASVAQISKWESGAYAPRYRAATEALDEVVGGGGELVDLLYGPPIERGEPAEPESSLLLDAVRELTEVVRQLRADLREGR